MDLLALLFSLCFPMLSGDDLLDHLPTDVYWKSKGIQVTSEAMIAQLQVEAVHSDAAGLVKQLGDDDFATRETATQKLLAAGPAVSKEIEAATKSEDPEVAARAKRILRNMQRGVLDGENRRLMAIRTLGELKQEAALPKLKTIAAQEKGDFARYANRAIGLIESAQQTGGDVSKIVTPDPLVPSEEELLADLSLLPSSSLGMAQLAISQRVRMPLESVLKFQPLFGRGIPTEQRESVYYAKLIELADEVGNVRIDSATASFTYLETERHAFVTCVIRGHYQWANLKSQLIKGGFREDRISGHEILRADDDVIFIPLSGQRLIAIAGELPENLPLRQMIEGKESPELLPQNEELWKMQGKISAENPGWAAMIAPKEFAMIPWLAALGKARMKITQDGASFSFLVGAEANDPAKVDSTLKALDKSLEHAQNESEQLANIIPAIKPLAEILVSLKYRKVPQGVVLESDTLDIGPLFALPLVLTSGEWCKQTQPLP